MVILTAPAIGVVQCSCGDPPPGITDPVEGFGPRLGQKESVAMHREGSGLLGRRERIKHTKGGLGCMLSWTPAEGAVRLVQAAEPAVPHSPLPWVMSGEASEPSDRRCRLKLGPA
ncbi:hypothetical protein NDU88_004563, partial [Pleurodeles waltl]